MPRTPLERAKNDTIHEDITFTSIADVKAYVPLNEGPHRLWHFSQLQMPLQNSHAAFTYLPWLRLPAPRDSLGKLTSAEFLTTAAAIAVQMPAITWLCTQSFK